MGTEREITILIDSREKQPLALPPSVETTRCKYVIRTRVQKLDEGDYQIAGHPQGFVIERKNGVDELLQCLTHHRERFMRMVERCLPYRTKVLIVTGHFSDVANRNYATRIAPHQAWCLIDGLQEVGLPVRFLPTREVSALYVINSARRYLERLDREADALRQTAPAPR